MSYILILMSFQTIYSINYDHPKYSIRNSEMKLIVPRFKIEFPKRSVLVRGSKIFNNLPEHVRLEISLSSFKAKLLDLT